MTTSAESARFVAAGTLHPVSDSQLLRELLWLSFPIVAENVLHMMVGLTDVYLAAHLPSEKAAATAAIGSVGFVLWLVGLIAGAIGAGSTAIIARTHGARHQRLANSVCGQSVTAAILLGTGLAAAFVLFASPLATITGLHGQAYGYSLFYIRVLSLCLPFSVLMYAAGACLRGAGDSLTPAIAMIIVDVVNMAFSASLARGWFGLPVMGFRGIAIGTVIAYAIGGVLMFAVLASGRGKIRLHLHRLRPHWTTLKRILRIGIPSGAEWVLTWIAQFIMMVVINSVDPTNVMAAAHTVAVRVESLSYMIGFAIATAAATMVGQALGAGSASRAQRSAWLAYAVGGGAMFLGGLLFLTRGRNLTGLMSDNQQIADLAARCLFITAFAQPGFAAALIFAGALRGAGDTMVVMVLNLASTLGLRLAGVLVVGWWLHLGLPAIWIVLSAELTLRGIFVFLRFLQGGWKHVKV